MARDQERPCYEDGDEEGLAKSMFGKALSISRALALDLTRSLDCIFGNGTWILSLEMVLTIPIVLLFVLGTLSIGIQH